MLARIIRIALNLVCLCVVTACSTARSNDGDHAPSRFARETAIPYYTSAPYERWPGAVFPDDPVDYYLRRETGHKLAAEGDCDTAVPVLSRLVEQYADDSTLWVDLGLCQDVLDLYPAAITSLKTALELGSAQVDGRFEAMPTELMVKIGWLYTESGNTEQALTWFRRGLEARYANRPSLVRQPEASLLKGNAAFADLAGLPPDETLTRDEKWRYDIAFFADQIAMLHYDPDQHTPAQDLERALQELSDAVPDLSDEEIVMRIQLLMGLLGAGHDVLFSGSARYGAAQAFTIRTYLFNDGIYVIESLDESLIGARIDAFGDTPATTAIRTVARSISRDNNQTARWNGPFLLTFPVMLQTLGIVQDADTTTLTITDREGKRRAVRPALGAPRPNSPALAAPPGVDAPLYLSRLNENYWTKYLPESNALYVQVNAMGDAREGESFSEFTRRLQREIADPGIHHVIVDLRHNIGGSDYLTNYLLRVLAHFDMEPEKGDLYVLIGRNTFSSTQIFITRLEPLTDAIFVGEPSGSRPNFIGRTGQFTLPYSGMSGFLSSELSQSSQPEDHRIWIAPDMPVGLSSVDFFSGRDPALDAIRKFILKKGDGVI